MTKMPIPDDWDGEDWRCVNITWPNSVWWNALLAGLISQAKRGRFWDEKTGSIADVQTIGREIMHRNLPFQSCDGTPPTTEDLFAAATGGGMGCIEIEEIMPCIDLTNMIKIEDGKLWVIDGCCNWHELGGLEGVTEPIDDPHDDDIVSYYACGKAFAVIDAVYKVAQSIYDEIDNFPWEWSGHVKNDNPGLQLSANYIAVGVVAATEISLIQDNIELWFGPQIFDETTKQSITCSLALRLDDTAEVPGNFRTILEEIFNGEWSINLLAQSFWFQVFAAIGSQDMANVALLGATDSDRDCDCPAPAAEASDIYFTGETELVGSANNTTMTLASPRNGGRRMLMSLEANTGSGSRSMTDFDLFLAGNEVADYVTVRLYPAEDPGIGVPSWDWEEYEGPAEPADFFEISCEGANPVIRVNGPGYVEFTSDQISPTSNPVKIRLEDMRFYPYTWSGGVREASFYVEIVAVNGNRLTAIGP